MRREWSEGIILGVAVGGIVMLLRVLLVAERGTQIIGLAIAAVALCVVQFALIVRRARRNIAAPSRDRPALFPRPRVRQNPFIREADQSWTGLVDHPPDAAQPSSSDASARSADEEHF